MKEKVALNIVLDMDQTLICGLTPRPYLEGFLGKCFEEFQHVSIWTAASNGWFNLINTHIFEPILKRLSLKYGTAVPLQFHFVFTEGRCSVVYDKADTCNGWKVVVEKRLRKLHRSKTTYSAYTMDNTLIIDDNKTTFRRNYGNAIHVPEFYVEDDDRIVGEWMFDDVLFRLCNYFDNVLVPHFEKHKTVRNFEKRNWMQHV